eukprot:CAMPEP_0185596862 /NCGR_PEP_ID=MMETSP0434-20130131/80998_1 /TAXON_ID=626734 ORGANISM="Favella taraikaensis, Strain Fe Narragansett Bay" /NCGR_SAMPLE_ID=MMETSP0434 /ASSEMBLY_ACC=CAM_ASM_000379 /LENGTH=123 /DNA_ID=CAMNT_0028225425 /DNA_START=1496 /DNA_END=1867 /DNA_ORIENTATION=-
MPSPLRPRKTVSINKSVDIREKASPTTKRGNPNLVSTESLCASPTNLDLVTGQGEIQSEPTSGTKKSPRASPGLKKGSNLSPKLSMRKINAGPLKPRKPTTYKVASRGEVNDTVLSSEINMFG